MSEAEQPRPRRNSPEWANTQLIKAMNHGKLPANGYNPIPRWQHKWQLKAKDDLHVLWAWMLDHTIDWPHRCEYAAITDEQGRHHAAHLENAQEDLHKSGWDMARVLHAWRRGMQVGLWRPGTKAEGKRRLYLCAEAEPQEVPELEGRTDGEPRSLRRLFSPAIYNIIKDWPKEKYKSLVAQEIRENLREEAFRADLDATRRALATERQDSRFAAWGLPVAHQVHIPKAAADLKAWQDRAARVDSIHKPALASAFEKFAQTYEESAQTNGNGVRKDEKNVGADPLSLSPQSTAREEPERACVPSVPVVAAVQTPTHDEEKSIEQQPMPPPLDEPHAQAIELLFRELQTMQETIPKNRLEIHVDPNHKGDQATLRKMLAAVGTEEMREFCLWVEKRARNNALGKPVHLGLILEWAGDFGRGRAERARRREAARLAAEKAAAADADLRTKREAQRARDQRLTDAMAAMPMDEWDRRMKVAAQELKADPEKLRMMRNMTRDQRDELARVRARLKLTTEIAARADLGVAGKWEDCPVCGNRSARHIELGVCLGDCAAQKGAAHG